MRRVAALILLLPVAAASPESRRYMLTGFDRIRVDGPVIVTVGPGGAQGATALGERRALDRLTVRVDAGLLVIARPRFGPDAAEAVTVAVTAASLRSAQVNGAGRLTIARMAGAQIEVGVNGEGALAAASVAGGDVHATLTGSGRVALAGNVGRLRILSQGSAGTAAGDLAARTVEVLGQTTGETVVRARESASVTASGSGTIAIRGGATCTVRGTAPVTCEGRIRRGF